MIETPVIEEQQIAAPAVAAPRPPTRVAYIMSRFPKLTETFILYEMLAVEEQGVEVELYPLMRARNTSVHPEGASVLAKIVERLSKPTEEVKMHPEARPLVERAHFYPFLSWGVLGAQLHFLFRRPLRYLSTLWTLIRANWGSPNYLLGSLAIFPKMAYTARQMQRHGITHVHAHFANHPAAAAYIVHRLADIPYSFTAHGADLQVDQHMLREKVEEAAFVVSISHYNRELILGHCEDAADENVLVVRCGVDTRVFEPREARQGGDAPFTILCIGTMYEVKGHTYLVEACRLLRERGVPFQCQFVGDGPFRESITAQIEEAGLGGQVHLLGQKTRAEVAELLRRADVLAMPSIPTDSGRREGIPVVLMEAMASGLPVVASGISGIPELVEDGSSGLLVPPRDPAALADALQRLSEDPALRERLGEQARSRVLDEFDQRTNAARLADLFSGEVVS